MRMFGLGALGQGDEPARVGEAGGSIPHRAAGRPALLTGPSEESRGTGPRVPTPIPRRRGPGARAAPGAARFVQSERLSGALVPAFRGMLTTATPAAFVAMNDALATRVQEAGRRA